MKKSLSRLELMSRRRLLRDAAAATASTSLLSALLNLRLTKAAVAAAGTINDYKALVCVFLSGGIDSHNMLTPYETAEYSDYEQVRGAAGTAGGLALPHEELLPISDAAGRQFGLHPGMPEVREMYNSGDFAFVANIGSMVVPTDRNAYNRRLNLPLGLFSHSDQQRHWQTSIPQSRTQITGWAGRMADCLTDAANSNPTISLNIALNGLNILQTGDHVIPYVIHESNAAQLLSGYGGGGAQNRILTRVTDSLLGQTYSDLLEQTHATTSRNSIDAAIAFNAAINGVELSTPFPNSGLGRQMGMVARSIGAREALGQKRQIFLVRLGGWDHHKYLISGQERLLPEFSQALMSFKLAMEELGVFNDVTTFTISDFARTLTSNGMGSDHAWGGNCCLMGGSVAGGNVYGQYPLSLSNPIGPNGDRLDVGRGRLIPTLSVDEYNAELAMWFGVSNGPDLDAILPNLRSFYPSGSAAKPIGFIG